MTDQHNVVLLAFADPAAGRAALEQAKHLPGLRQAAVLERSAEGLLEMGESFARGAGVPTVGSGVVGGLIGMLGGPVGAFLGFAAGAALGNAAEEERSATGGAGLIVLGPRVEDGTGLLVLDIKEASPEPADRFAAEHGATVDRLPAEEFAEQVKAAEQAAD
ncbi:histidine kinase [Kitasatospora sp. NPDC002040]|uniref:histidine kinase n=1 Tax=Kitasatospora sp. NPDC002040 TaxID=3154661 RepID=UPI00331E2109